MKAITLPLIAAISILAYTQDIDSDEKLQKEKLALIQKLFTCQSIASSIRSEIDVQTRRDYIRLGNKYYNNAYQSYLTIQELEPDIDTTLRENISNLLLLYSKSFESVESLYKQNMVLAVEFAPKILDNVMLDLFCEKKGTLYP